MKILLISPPAYPLFDGGRLIAYHLGQEMQRRGHVVDLLAYSQRAEDRRQQHHYDRFFRHVELIDDEQRAPSQFLYRLARPGARWPRRARDSWSPDMWRAIERRLGSEQYDVAQLIGGAYVYDSFEALRGLPAVITPCDSFALLARRSMQREGIGTLERLRCRGRWLTARKYEQWMYSPFARTVVVSDVDRAELLAGNPSLRVDVIPNGVDLGTFRAGSGERAEAALLFVGNFRYPPNTDAALQLATEILPRVREQIPQAKLWLVGNEPPASLTALANDSITVTGRVPDVRPYLAQAAAFVSPLRLGAGMKNKVLEALAMGCPLIATPLSVDGIAVTDGHDALIANDHALTAATVRVLQDAGLRSRLSANGPVLIEARYSWTRVAQMYESLYGAVRRA
jgi:glycosyltransferase involved in cell wall biosynthesis